MRYILKSFEIVNHIITIFIACIPICLAISSPIFYGAALIAVYMSNYGSVEMMLLIVGIYPFSVLYLALMMKMKDVFCDWISNDDD